MTNEQKFLKLTEQLESPEMFLRLSWYWAVATALERRVFFGDFSRAQFCNLYVLLIGPPAVGKGSAMREATKLVSHYLYTAPDGTAPLDPSTLERQRLFASLPDTASFELLVESLSKLTRVIKTSETSVYGFIAAYFALEELSSLLRKNKSEDVAQFLLNMYDGYEYKYSTRHKGKFVIRNAALNFIAGTQIDFVRQAESAGLLGQGLFSRFLICYQTEKRQLVFDYDNLTEEQVAIQKELQIYLKSLSKLYGQVQYGPGVLEHLKEWYADEVTHVAQYNESKLQHYFSRRKDQVKRLAAAMHFGESSDLTIGLEPFVRAAGIMRQLESTIITMTKQTGKNPNFPISEQLVNLIKRRPRSSAECMQFLSSDADLIEAANIIKMLETCNRIVRNSATGMYEIV